LAARVPVTMVAYDDAFALVLLHLFLLLLLLLLAAAR
jgi:hypothetical protein